MHRTVRIAGLSVATVLLAGCGLQQPAPFDPGVLQEPDRSSAQQLTPAPMRPLPTTLESLPPTTQGAAQGAAPQSSGPRQATGHPAGDLPTIRLSLREIVQRSVVNSREVKVAGYDAAIAQTRVVEAQAHFDPIFFTNLKYEHQDAATAGQLIPDPADPLKNILLNVERGDIYTIEPGVKEQLPSGGQASISYQLQDSHFSPKTFEVNPYWENQLKLEFDQPLLRQFGYDVNQAKITIARNDQRVSILDFRKALEENIANIEKDYWDLVEAEQEVLIQVELLNRTMDTADVLIGRFEAGGDVSRVQTSQATASVRSREAVLIAARARLGDISDDLKRRMNDPEFPVAGEVVILASDLPLETMIQFDPKDQIDTAMENRLELGQQQLRISSADVASDVAKNNLLPKLDLQTTVGLQGLKADEGNALTQDTEDGHISYSFALQFELPIGNREARSVYRRAELQRSQAIEQYGFLVEQVSQDVKTALREVQTTWEELGARRQARFAASDSLHAIDQQEEHGEALTPTFVQLKLDSQERLADAQREEATALSSYNDAISHLERAKGTLLRYNDVVMQEDPSLH
jgi:outer membrane protein TolC